jgi:ribosomal protein L29
MALIRNKDVEKMNDKERFEKLKELKLELTKANVTANKTNAKNKEIKKAIARILTFNKSQKQKGGKLKS